MSIVVVKVHLWKKIVSGLMAFIFAVGSVGTSYAQGVSMSAPGTMVSLSASFAPPLLKGLKVYPDNPFRLDFILDKGNSSDSTEQLKLESTRLIKYFLASITVPEKDLWVNLSPYEKDRIVPDAFGVTEMGRDLLAQDYMLKQITASVIYPEGEVGKAFWAKVYAEAQKRYGTSDVPVDTFNKVWIVPEKAVVYETKDSAYVVESKLKVMLEEDYLALEKSTAAAEQSTRAANKLGSDIVREVVIPILEKEVNEGKNFAQLRQVYQSLILAIWYKDKVKESIFGKAYVDQKNTGGVDIADKAAKDKIWAQYVEAFKKGAYNYIKEDLDPVTQQAVPRKYFSGGAGLYKTRGILVKSHDRAQLPQGVSDRAMILESNFKFMGDLQGAGDWAMAPQKDNPLEKSWQVFEEEWRQAKLKPLRKDVRSVDEELKFLLHFNLPDGMIAKVQERLKALLPDSIVDKIAWDAPDLPYVSVTYFTADKNDKERIAQDTGSTVNGVIRDHLRPFKFTAKGVGLFNGMALFVPMLMDEKATQAAKEVQAGFNQLTQKGPAFDQFVAHATFGWIIADMSVEEREILFSAVEKLRYEVWDSYQVDSVSLSERWFYRDRTFDKRKEITTYPLVDRAQMNGANYFLSVFADPELFEAINKAIPFINDLVAL